MRLRGRLLTAAAAVVCAAVLSSCASPDRPARTPVPSADREFDVLVSSRNGYHYPPFLREQPAAPEAQSYALRTLTELGRGPRVRLSADRAASMRRDALAASPLWGRTWLIPLREAGASWVLGAQDARAVAGLRSKGGWYVDPALGDDGDASRLGGTWAALEVLDALDRLPERPSATVGWLRSMARTPRPPAERAALARSLSLLRRPVPAVLTDADPPRTDDWQTLDGGARADLLSDTYHHVLAQEAAGHHPVVHRTHWEAVLQQGAPTLPYEQLHLLVHLLKAAGSRPAVFAPVAARLEAERLEDGTVRDPDSYVGDPQSSLFVERLRALAGRPRRDPRLLAALDREETSGGGPRDGAERLSRAALRAVAGGPSEPARQLCADPAVLPRTVTEHNATWWQRTALDCADAGVTIDAPEVRRWALETPEEVVAAATVAVGLADSGHRRRTPRWITSYGLKPWTRAPQRFASVYDYTLVVRAHLLLGGEPDPALRAALERGVTPYRGCPGLPDLYRVGGDDPACDLKTTWGVWTLDRQTHGKRAEER
ncbi:hypothetical protein RKD23_004056 [Streptomyces sp. SAI-170]|uniref:hypothetical protein n=1 Tax=Streptomyces sp. SAI-170 TaxID=3377729 RepID=UPI003C7D168D